MTPPPYPNQGEPVPPYDGIEGAWVFWNQVFIFRNRTELILPTRFSDELVGLGFSIEAMARTLKKTPDQIWAFNQEKQLWVGWEDARATRGADITETFTFITPDGFRMTAPVNSFAIRGHA
jgi:hypothetical protein